jgi:hypothetical protein
MQKSEVGRLVEQLDRDRRSGHITAEQHEGMGAFFEELAAEVVTRANE